MVKHIILPGSGCKQCCLKRTINGGSAFLLDGGKGSFNSYHGIDDYIETTNNKMKGQGLSDKMNKYLNKLSINQNTPNKPKMKNITLSL
jgi:hypothetical protein